MKNEFHKIALTTGIANFPEIVNYNNKCISDEFDTIRDENDKVILDVSANTVNAINSKITNLTVNEINIVDSTGSGVNIRQYVNDIVANNSRVLEAKTFSAPVSTPVVESTQVYSAAATGTTVEIPEYDVTAFFSSSIKGVIDGIKTEHLLRVRLYRMLDGLKIPVNVGSIVIGEKLRMMLYHDHIVSTPQTKRVERVFVPIVNGADKRSVIQYAPADTVKLN